LNDYKPYKAYTSYGGVMVAFSALKAGGFNPIFQNLHSAQINMFEALALGGYWIFLPEDEQAEALDWQDWLLKNPIKDSGTSIRKKNYWGSTILAAICYFYVTILPLIVILWGIDALVQRLKRKDNYYDSPR